MNKQDWLLSEDEIRTLLDKLYGEGINVTVMVADKAISNAQFVKALRMVKEWGEELCPHFTIRTKKRACPECWQELMAQVEK